MQKPIASAMRLMVRQQPAKVKAFVGKCVAAGRSGKPFPIDEQIGDVTVIWYDYDNPRLIEFRAE